MHIKIDDNMVDSVVIDSVSSSCSELDDLMQEIILNRKIDAMEYSIKNPYLRAIKKKKGQYKKQTVDFEYHFLEKPSGVNNIYCVGSDMKKKKLKFNMPYTIMVVKILYLNGVYVKIADKVFHSNEPIKKDLSNSLWEWGLSNVYEHTHNICWGREKLPKIDNQNTSQYMDEFFIRVKNKDLLRNKNIDWNKMSSGTVYDLDIKTLKRLPFKLDSVIGKNEF